MGKTTAELEAQTGRFRAVGFEDPEHKQDDRGYFYAVVWRDKRGRLVNQAVAS